MGHPNVPLRVGVQRVVGRADAPADLQSAGPDAVWGAQTRYSHVHNPFLVAYTEGRFANRGCTSARDHL